MSAYDELFNMGVKVSSNQDSRSRLQKEIEMNLGGGLIDLELEPDHYDFAINKALDKFRTRSVHADEESFVFLDLQEGQMDYRLPNEVMKVRQAFRRGIGQGTTSAAGGIDPFASAMVNNLYLIPSSGSGGLATYDFALQHRELVGRMFGEHLIFHYDSQSKKIVFHRRFVGAETVMLWVDNYRPDNVLMTDVTTRQWLRSWATAECKMMLGEARELYGQLPGPNGGTTLNGAQLKSEATQDFERLEQDMWLHRDGGEVGFGFTIG